MLDRFRRLAGAVRRGLDELPGLGKLGLAIIAVGILFDVAHHAVTRSTSIHVPCCGIGFIGHVATVGGMLVVVVALLAVAFRPHRRPAPPGGRR